MQRYDFVSLDDKEFEILVCHLLSASEGARFERFKPGRDAGVDGRYFSSCRGETVLQCKHWARSSVSALIRGLEKTEVEKVKRLAPARYILATSLSLSRKDKHNIARPFGGALAEPDVLGKEDLNDLLAKFPDIEHNHYKLWITSTAVLERVLHASILGRSDFHLRAIQERAHLYVQTAHYEEAVKKLNENGVILITGEPGIGKTTLAEQLCLNHALQDLQICVLSDAIEEAESVFVPAKPQLFYFDDFLGRNYLEALGRHEDSKIMNFIRRIAADKSKRFVLTSRTTILNQGKGLTDLFNLDRLDKNEFEIKVTTLTELERARILYMHFWHSALPVQFLEEVLAEKRYRRIIEHDNFNPRLIQFITDGQRLPSMDAAGYWPHIERTLQHPEAVWHHVYDAQLDDFGRLLLQLVVLNGGEIGEEALRGAYGRFVGIGSAATFRGRDDFIVNLRMAVGSVLNRATDRQNRSVIDLFNPSIGDYVLSRIGNDDHSLRTRLVALSSVESCEVLRALIRNKIIGNAVGGDAIRHLVLIAQAAQDSNYRAVVGHLAAAYIIDDKSVRAALEVLINRATPISGDFTQYARLCSMIRRCTVAGFVQADGLVDIVDALCGRDLGSFDEADLAAMAALCLILPPAQADDFEAFLRLAIVDYWSDAIAEHISEQQLLADLYDESELLRGEEIVEAEIRRILDEYGLQFSPLDVGVIGKWVDVEDIIQSNQQVSGDDRDYREFGHGPTGPDAIDDLFQVDLPTV